MDSLLSLGSGNQRWTVIAIDGEFRLPTSKLRRAHELLPRSAAIMKMFTGSQSESESSPILDVARQLAANHHQQWNAEDACRPPEASDAHVASAKRVIDGLNARRVALVEELDALVAQEICNAPDASLHTETLGSVIDRLAIAWVRSRNVGVGSTDRTRAALRQMIELAAAYDDLVRDVSAGRRRLPIWLPLKRYGGSS
jgi:hypothetical protein